MNVPGADYAVWTGNGGCWHRSHAHAGVNPCSWTRAFAEQGLGLRPCSTCAGTSRCLTTVVHVNHPDGFTLYCGRASRRAKNPAAHVESPWANPYSISVAGSRDEAIAMFARNLADNHRTPWSWMRDHLHELRGLRLACWCAPPDRVLTSADPLMCHCQILAAWADRLVVPRG